MEIVIESTPAAVASVVADIVERQLLGNAASVLGLATGSSPLAAYAELIERCRAERVSFARATAFLLDEYIGLPVGHPESYRAFIRRHFTDQVDFSPGAVHGPAGDVDDIERACDDYETAITASGGVDVQLLGIGSDGHVGFNEPTSSLRSRTRVKTLTTETRRDNARFFGSIDEVPRHVITQGIGTILDARHVVLIATGPAKAAPIARAVEGPLAAFCPASAIQMHPHATVVIDEEAAADLRLRDYYRDTVRDKPSWQHF